MPRSLVSALVSSLLTGLCAAGADLRGSSTHYANLTNTFNSYQPHPTRCCYLAAFAVARNIWYSRTISVEVATIFTNIYQYNDIARTSYSTVLVNNTLPKTIFSFNEHIFSGIPTDLVDGGGAYAASTLLITGTVFTDPYGVEYTSPTPVLMVPRATYVLSEPTTNDHGSYEQCSFDGRPGPNLYMQAVEPSGFFMDYGKHWSSDDDDNGRFYTILPTELRQWIVAHPNPTAEPIWSDVANCTMATGDGVPIAHIPVTELTARKVSTILVDANYVTAEPTSPSDQQSSSAVPPSSPSSQPAKTSELQTPSLTSSPLQQTDKSSSSTSSSANQLPNTDNNGTPSKSSVPDKENPSEIASNPKPEDSPQKQDPVNTSGEGAPIKTTQTPKSEDINIEPPTHNTDAPKAQNTQTVQKVTTEEAPPSETNNQVQQPGEQKTSENEPFQTSTKDATKSISQLQNTPPKQTTAPLIVLDGTTYAADQLTNSIITISGSIVTLPASGTVITEGTTTRTQHVGDAIASIMGFDKVVDDSAKTSAGNIGNESNSTSEVAGASIIQVSAAAMRSRALDEWYRAFASFGLLFLMYVN